MDLFTKTFGPRVRRLNHGLSMHNPLRIYHKTINRIIQGWYGSCDRHYEVDLGIVLSGEIIGTHGNRPILYKTGDVWLTGIWEPHGWELPNPPCEILDIFILPEFLDNVRHGKVLECNLLTPFIVLPKDRPITRTKNKIAILDIARKLIHLGAQKNTYQVNMAKIYLMELLVLLMNEWAVPPQKSEVSTDTFLKISPAFHLLFSRRVSVGILEAAKACNLTPRSFNKLFFQAMNAPFVEYAREYRLKGVLNDLLKTDKPVKTLAWEWGFSHLSHLDRCFRRQFGCSPREYLVAHKSQIE
jgi:AraC-like DNA-binding protein